MQTVQRHRFGSPKGHSGAASVPNVFSSLGGSELHGWADGKTEPGVIRVKIGEGRNGFGIPSIPDEDAAQDRDVRVNQRGEAVEAGGIAKGVPVAGNGGHPNAVLGFRSVVAPCRAA